MKILPLSDLHLPKPASQTILQNRDLLDCLDLVVLMGDMVAAYGTDAEYRAVREFLDDLRAPTQIVSGNHEWYFEEFDEVSGFYGEIWNQASNAESRAKIERFRAFYGLDSLWRSFGNELGKFVFLSLDDVPSQKQESLSRAQWDFLENELRGAGEAPVWVFCHCPVLLEKRLDFVYYDEDRTGCVEPKNGVFEALLTREAPTFWMSGHVHLHPNHYLFAPYKAGGNVWQIHCPDSWGYGRWARSHNVPKRYDGPFSRLLEIDARGVDFVTIDHRAQSRRESYRVNF